MKRNLGLAGVFLGLAVYLVLFYAVRMPSLEGVTGGPFHRAGYLLDVLLLDEVARGWFGPAGQGAIFDRLPVLAVAGAIVGYGFCLGWLLLALIRADRGLAKLEVFVFSTAVGLSVVSTYVLLVGLLGWLGHFLVFAVPAVLTLAAAGWLWWKRSPSLPRSVGERTARNAPRRKGKKHRRASVPACSRTSEDACATLSCHWLWLAAPFVLAVLLGGMLPPVDFDVREYHLEVPKEFYQDGRIGFLPHNIYGNMPMGAEMHALLAMVLSRDWWWGALAGKTVMALFAPLTALGLLAAGRRLFSTTAGVVAAVVYLSIPWVVQVSAAGLVEGVYACYLFLAVYALLLWDGTGLRDPRLLVAGFLAGSAAATKYPAVLFVVVPLAVWVVAKTGGVSAVWAGLSRKRLEEDRVAEKKTSPLVAAGVFLLAATLAGGLWYGKNWALAGNPTYPLLYGVFGGETWTEAKDARWNDAHRPDWPEDFTGAKLADSAGRVVLRSEWLSPLVMPLAALALVTWWRWKTRAVPWLVLYFAFILAAWWALTHRIDRFWVPALPLVALLAGVGACWSRDRAWRWGLIGLLLVGAGGSFLMVAVPRPGYDTRFFAPLAFLRHDPLRVDAWHRYLNRHARDGGVLLVGDAEVFDLEVPVVYNTVFDDGIFEELVRGRTPEEVRAALAERGIRYVYVDWGEIARYRSPGNYGFTDFVQPEVFQGLVEAGVLEPWPERPPEELRDHPGRGYRVVGAAAERQR